MKKDYNKSIIIKPKNKRKYFILLIPIIFILVFMFFKSKPFYNISFQDWNTNYLNYISENTSNKNIETNYYNYKIKNKDIVEASQEDRDIVLVISKEMVSPEKYNIFFSYLWIHNPIKFDKYQISLNNSKAVDTSNIKRKIINNSNLKVIAECNSAFSIAPGTDELFFSYFTKENYTNGPYTSDIISFPTTNIKDLLITYEFKLEDRKNTYKIQIPGL
ncbi:MULTISPECIES: hypothetical protein [Clostridium]|nr:MULTISPECIES: hypothetical protein [Clostridium]MDB2075690.1 hypothetical protein [Clostridium paraputrificum]MDB2080189.1 hypothetical protein [Clostridium paraputrificum]MDB2092800.1 hypothetical protein [Clostridium paraputrificum]MDB2099773.1 hypothetical protein [Clostridium paraputrificum]MDB2107964.1 hypothetical protein [Clostridium paraputrificum]